MHYVRVKVGLSHPLRDSWVSSHFSGQAQKPYLMVMCIFCNRGSFDMYFVDCCFVFFFVLVQYWGGWKTKLQLFAFLLPKPSHMTRQGFCAFAQQGPYLSCLRWERENIYPSWMNKTCRHLLHFALAFRQVQVRFIKWQRLGHFTYCVSQT